MNDQLRPQIEACYQQLQSEPKKALSSDQTASIHQAMQLLDSGQIRVCSKTGETWQTHAWVKQAILLYFSIAPNEKIHASPFEWRDKVPVKKWVEDSGVRSVPLSLVRFGAFVNKNTILMPSFVNIGAYVDSGTMVDTWATVGSCAQIGKNVHLSGGVGIGGVLEPAQAAPVIIEDNCFVGSRAIVVEGVHVKAGAVLGAGVVLTKSTPIIDATVAGSQLPRGVVPENSVVIPGTMPKTFPAGVFQVPCALIIGKRSASTDLKTSLNKVLREMEVPV